MGCYSDGWALAMVRVVMEEDAKMMFKKTTCGLKERRKDTRSREK